VALRVAVPVGVGDDAGLVEGDLALAGGLAALLAGAVALAQQRSGPQPTGGQVPMAVPSPRRLRRCGCSSPEASPALRTGARRTIRLPELRPGCRCLVELVPLAGGAVAGIVADDAE